MSKKLISCLILLCHTLHELTISLETKEINSKQTYKPEKFKYIALWYNKAWFSQWSTEGQALFLDNKCEKDTCFLTSNQGFFGEDLYKFDAIVFYGPYIRYYYEENLPIRRYSHQKYIYLNPGSADQYPECTGKFQEFFNWTITSRVDSEIQLKYVTFRDMDGKIVAPSERPNWLQGENEFDKKKIMDEIETKTKAVAWCVSQCNSTKGINLYIKTLHKELKKYNLSIDVYARCGNFSCYKNYTTCDAMFKKSYYFYLAFERTEVLDYVTEQALYAYSNQLVPIVYGGGDYNGFLPPRSYIDAFDVSAATLAAKINSIIQDKEEYANYFWWLSYYKMHCGFTDAFGDAVCQLCAMLHNEEQVNKHSAYLDLRKWWSPNYKKGCVYNDFSTQNTTLLNTIGQLMFQYLVEG